MPVCVCAYVHVRVCVSVGEGESEIMDRSRPPGPTERSKVSTRDVFKLLPLRSSYPA